MPSVTDIQQQSSKISVTSHGKSTPPLSQQQQQISSTLTGNTTDTTNVDPITQAILILEKKQRNLGKRKEKLESYEQEAKAGKDLNKDQKEALAKYGEVLGQIECAKDIAEQLKKIQTESAKNQKRLSKQAAEEKRLLIAQRLREYAYLRYLLDHRPSSLKPEESSLLDELTRVINPSDASLNTITRSVDTVLSIYQGGPLSSIIKNITGRTSQEVREILEQLIKQFETSSSSSSSSSTSNDTSTPQQIQLIETVKQTPLVPQAPPTTPASVLPQRDQSKQQQQSNNNNDVMGPSLSHTHLVQTNANDRPVQFDTREQNISLQQIIHDSPFFSPDLTTTNNNQQLNQDSSNSQQQISNNQDNTQIQQSNDSQQYLPSFTVLNSTLPGQVLPQGYVPTPSAPTQQQQQQGVNNYDQESSSNVVSSSNVPTDEQQSEEQWQHRRGNSGNAHRGGQYNGTAQRNYNRGGGPNNYNQQQHWRGPRGGHYDGSYSGGQRQYNENNNRGGGGQRGGPNPNYRGNRGGNYRGGKRGGSAGYNGNEYQKSSQYQQHDGQQQVRSAPPNHQQ